MEAWGQGCSGASLGCPSPALGTVASGGGELQGWSAEPACKRLAFIIVIFKENLQTWSTAGTLVSVSVKKQRRLDYVLGPQGPSLPCRSGVAGAEISSPADARALPAGQTDRGWSSPGWAGRQFRKH